jgi:hypothetical protein
VVAVPGTQSGPAAPVILFKKCVLIDQGGIEALAERCEALLDTLLL